MNGGSFQNNGAIYGSRLWTSCGGAVCVEGGSAFFNGVEFKENIAPSDTSLGAAIYVEDGGKVVIENCTFDRNGIQTADKLAAETVIHGEDSSITITNSPFTDNAGEDLFHVEDGNLIINGGTITKTVGTNVFYLEDTQADMEGVTITDNACGVMTLENGDELVNMIGCTLGNNTPTQTEAAFVIDEPNTLILRDCTLGNTTFSDKQYVKITTSEVTREEALIGVELLREDGTVDSVRYYKDFVSGWGYAIESAKTGFFGRVAVSLYADWNTYEYGVVSIPENARMTLNLNGHKIDRAKTGPNYDGEVLYVSANADVTISGGTITGGYSETGAGGIHIKDNAKVLLNDVKVDNNKSKGTNGAAIAVYNGATLVMNGGSLSDNVMNYDAIVILLPVIPSYPYGTLYVEDATATLNNVTISDNTVGTPDAEGAAIYADSSTVTLNDCVVSGNINNEKVHYAESVIGAEDSTLIINNTDFTDNGQVSETNDSDYCSLFELVDSKLTMKGGKITGNHADKIFCLDDTKADITGVTVTGNASIILDVENDSAKVTLTDCTLDGNEPVKEEFDVIVDVKGILTMSNCDLGDTVFEDKRYVDFGNGAGVGSIFGEGSLAMVISILALVTSVVSIFLIADVKKLVSATANGADKSDAEE